MISSMPATAGAGASCAPTTNGDDNAKASAYRLTISPGFFFMRDPQHADASGYSTPAGNRAGNGGHSLSVPTGVCRPDAADHRKRRMSPLLHGGHHELRALTRGGRPPRGHRLESGIEA